MENRLARQLAARLSILPILPPWGSDRVDRHICCRDRHARGACTVLSWSAILEERSHLFVAHKLATPGLRPSFPDSGTGLLIEAHGLAFSRKQGEQHFGSFVLFGLRKLPYLFDR